MLKISVFGLLVALGLAAVLFVGTPRTTQVMAREEPVFADANACPMKDVVIDEGYGVARHAMKPACVR